jgi:hypothetical protein
MNVMHFIKASSFNFQGQGYENHDFLFIQRTLSFSFRALGLIPDLVIAIDSRKHGFCTLRNASSGRFDKNRGPFVSGFPLSCSFLLIKEISFNLTDSHPIFLF